MTETDSECGPRRRHGRPTTYDRRKAQAVLDGIAGHGNMARACSAAGVRLGAFRGWLEDDRDGLAARYRKARRVRAMMLLDEIDQIVDDGSMDWRPGPNGPVLNHEHLRRCKARINRRLWEAGRWLPPELGGDPEKGCIGAVEIRIVERF